MASNSGESDRRKRFSYQVRYGQGGFGTDDYRVLQSSELLEEARAKGDLLVLEKRREKNTQFDLATGLPIVTEERFDFDTVAKTRRTFDGETGNVRSVTKPMQGSTGGSDRSTVHSYDKHKLFVTKTVNELGHTSLWRRDLATGVLLGRRGANSVRLSSGEIVFEREVWEIDGFGRILVHSVSIDHSTKGYVLLPVSRSTFFDEEQPNRIRIERRRDLGTGDVQISTERTTDGLGRVLTETQFTGGSRDLVTSFSYDSGGGLAAITGPDPRADSGSSVRYEYNHDGLGRLTAFKRPDATGVAFTYDGLEKTIREVSGDGSGGRKKEVVDVFGRLVEVHELELNSGPAITRYRYDAQDNLSAITDADGNSITLTHDMAGHRTAIARGERIWRYGYDLNGNLSTRIAPGDAEPALHTTSYTYDDIDRVTTSNYVDVTIDSLQIDSYAKEPPQYAVHL